MVKEHLDKSRIIERIIKFIFVLIAIALSISFNINFVEAPSPIRLTPIFSNNSINNSNTTNQSILDINILKPIKLEPENITEISNIIEENNESTEINIVDDELNNELDDELDDELDNELDEDNLMNNYNFTEEYEIIQNDSIKNMNKIDYLFTDKNAKIINDKIRVDENVEWILESNNDTIILPPSISSIEINETYIEITNANKTINADILKNNSEKLNKIKALEKELETIKNNRKEQNLIGKVAIDLGVTSLEKSIEKEKENTLDMNEPVKIKFASNSSKTIRYTTIAPRKYEKEITKFRKFVNISSEMHYLNVIAFTDLPSEASKENIKLYWIINDTRTIFDYNNYNITYIDSNNNSLIDKIEWTVPHLSDQTFEIIIITKAYELNNEKIEIKDIYELVKEKDEIFANISENNYVRAIFEKQLDNKKDITIYAKSDNNARIVVYEKDKDNIIADFGIISDYKEYKIYLSNITNISDTFDLRIINGNVHIDYIVDPHPTLYFRSIRGTENLNVISRDITLPYTVNTSRAIVLISTRSTGTTPNILQVTGNLINGNTLRLQKYSATATIVEWQVIESSEFIVSRGETTTPLTTTTSMNINIGRTVNLSRTFIILNSRINTGTAANMVRSFWSGQFLDSTRFNVQRGISGTNAIVSWQIVEWIGSEVIYGTGTASNTPTHVAIGKTINLSNSFIIKTSRATATQASHSMPQVYFNNDTHVALRRVGATGTTTVNYFIISHKNITTQQKNLRFTGNTAQDISINYVNTSRSLSLGTNDHSSAETAYDRAFVANILFDRDTLRVQKSDGSRIENGTWFVMEYTNVANLTIWDDTNDAKGLNEKHAVDEYVGFYANYTDLFDDKIYNQSIASCNIKFNLTGSWSSPTNMIFNTSKNIWTYDRKFDKNGTFTYNISCYSKYGFRTNTDTFKIDLSMPNLKTARKIIFDNIINKYNVSFTIKSDTDHKYTVKLYAFVESGTLASDFTITPTYSGTYLGGTYYIWNITIPKYGSKTLSYLTDFIDESKMIVFYGIG